MEKTVHPNNEKNITLTKSCQVEESYVDPYDANSPDVIFPVTITRTPLEKITCTSPVNGYTRLVKMCTSWYLRNYFVLVTYSGGQKGRNDFVSKITNKVVSSFLGTTVDTVTRN